MTRKTCFVYFAPDCDCADVSNHTRDTTQEVGWFSFSKREPLDNLECCTRGRCGRRPCANSKAQAVLRLLECCTRALCGRRLSDRHREQGHAGLAVSGCTVIPTAAAIPVIPMAHSAAPTVLPMTITHCLTHDDHAAGLRSPCLAEGT